MNLIVENLRIDRGERTIIDGLSFQASSGEAVVITGPNGSGKSTLLRAIAGFLPVAGGSIQLEPKSETPIAENCHYLGHLNGLKPALTVVENLNFWREFGKPTEVSAHSALETVQLRQIADLPVSYLSAGQKRRVAIAKLLVSHRDIWLVDEPTAALDRDSEQMFSNILQDHTEKGGIAVAATHQPLELKNPQSLDIGKYSRTLMEQV